MEKRINKMAAELLVANKELAFQYEEEAKHAAELIVANKELKKKFLKTKKLEKELFKLLEGHSAILDNHPDIIGRFDKNCRCLYINHPFIAGRNRTRESFIGKTIRDRGFSEEITQAYEEAIEYVFTTGKQKTIQVTIFVDGNLHCFETRYTPEFSANGLLTSVFSISLDITERKKIEQEMEAHTAKLTIANKELEQFSYLSSHDLSEPLLTIRNFTELILAEHGQDFTDVSNRYFQVISQSAIRMEDLLRGLLDFSRISNPKQLNDEVDCNE